MAFAFTSLDDIGKRACQHLGIQRFGALTDSSRQATELNYALPLLRRAEFRRSAWTFAARRAVLRPRSATMFKMTPLAYAAGTTYAAGVVIVDSGGYPWISTRASNLANTPGTTGVNPAWVSYFGPLVAELWASPGPYFPGDVVYKTGSPAKAYILLGSSVATTADPASGAPWQEISGATVAALVNFEPKGYAPTPAAATARTLYDLPANFMRLAPQDVKTASAPRQMVTGGQQHNDWEVEGNIIASAALTGPIIFRFTADTADIASADDMFCEGLAARAAMEVCESLTGSDQKLGEMTGIYTRWIGEARAVSAIEAGSSELEGPLQPAIPPGQPARGAPAGQGG